MNFIGIHTFWSRMGRTILHNNFSNMDDNTIKNGITHILSRFNNWFGPVIGNNLLTNTLPQKQQVNQTEMQILIEAINIPDIIEKVTRRSTDQITVADAQTLLPVQLSQRMTRTNVTALQNLSVTRVQQLAQRGLSRVKVQCYIPYKIVSGGSERIQKMIFELTNADILLTNLSVPRPKRSFARSIHDVPTITRLRNSLTNVVNIIVPVPAAPAHAPAAPAAPAAARAFTFPANMNANIGKKNIFKILILMSLDSIHDKVLTRLRDSGVNISFLNMYHARFIKGLFTNAFYLLLQIFDPTDRFCCFLYIYLANHFDYDNNDIPTADDTTYSVLYERAPDLAPNGFEEQMFNLMRTDLNSQSGTKADLTTLCNSCINAADNVSYPDQYNIDVCTMTVNADNISIQRPIQLIKTAGIGPAVDGGSEFSNDVESYFYKSNLDITIQGGDEGDFGIVANIIANNLLHLTFQYGGATKTYDVPVQRHHNGEIYVRENPVILTFINRLPVNENQVIQSIFNFGFKWSLDALQMLCLLNSGAPVDWTADRPVNFDQRDNDAMPNANPQNGQLSSTIRKTGDILDFVIACYMKQIFDPNANSNHIINFLNCQKTKAYYHNNADGAGVLKVISTAFPPLLGHGGSPQGDPRRGSTSAGGGKKYKGGTINGYDANEETYNNSACVNMLQSFRQPNRVAHCSDKENVFNSQGEFKHTLVSCLELISYMQIADDANINIITNMSHNDLAQIVSELLTFLSTPPPPEYYENITLRNINNVVVGNITYKNNYDVLQLINLDEVSITETDYNTAKEAAKEINRIRQIGVDYIANFATIQIMNYEKPYGNFGNMCMALIEGQKTACKQYETQAKMAEITEIREKMQAAERIQRRLELEKQADIDRVESEEKERKRLVSKRKRNNNNPFIFLPPLPQPNNFLPQNYLLPPPPPVNDFLDNLLPNTKRVKVGGKRKTRRNKPKKTRKRFQKRSKKFQKKSRKA